MRLGEMVFRYHLSTYTDRRKAGETRLAIAVRRAGGFEDLGSGIGESNATAAGGFEDLGSGIGESNATRAGGFEDLGSGIGESNATAAGGFEDLGSGIGESNATAAGGFEDLGSRIGESRTIEVGDSIALDDIPAENTSARSPVRKSKCGFSFRQHGVAEFIGAPETSNPEVINESMIT